MKKNLYIFVLSFAHFLSAQKIDKGTYVGYEQNPFCYSNDCITNNINLEKNKYYFKITLRITDTQSELSKISVKYIRRNKQVVDSLRGGFFLYQIDQVNDHIYGTLIKTKYNRKPGSGFRRYVHANYAFIRNDKGIILNNERNKNIFLIKID